jgi:DNA-binding NarL/FixJ family response regulator
MPLTVLAVDDDYATRVALMGYLEIQGYHVVLASDGKAALEMVDTHRPHLLITDINMPRMDGFELVRQLRSRPPLRLLPVVFLTERLETEQRVQGYNLGCDAYLGKPFELVELGAVVRNLLDRAQMIAQEVQFQRLESSSSSSSPKSDGSSHPGERLIHRLEPDASLVLSLREQEVLRHLADGLSNSQIGEHLHLSHRTVEKHVSSLLRKTMTHNRSELLRYALEHGLTDWGMTGESNS